MEKSTAKNVFIITCISYFSFGSMWASIGTMLAQFAVNNSVTLATIGGIYSAIFLGAILSQIVLGPLTDRWGQLRSLTVALLTMALAMIGVSLSRWLPLTFALAFIAGLGQGLSNLCGNVLVGQLFQENSVSRVNLLNVFWGMGAFAGPLLVSGSNYLWQSGIPAFVFCASLIVLSGLILLLGFFKIKIGIQAQAKELSAPKRMHISPFLWGLGGMVLIYVGAESAMGGWSTTYIQKTDRVTIELAALVTAGFWLAMTLGRLMGTILGSRVQAKKVLILCLGVELMGVILFVAGYGNALLSIAAIFVVGLGMGAFYPTTMAVATSTFAKTPGQAGTVIALMGSIGGVFIPWLQGVVMEKAGIRSGTFMVAALVLLMITGFLLTQRAKNSEQAS